MIPFPDKKYNIIYADPPWQYHLWKVSHSMPHSKREVRMASAFYNTMSTEEICNLPVQQIADKECMLFMWVTNPLLPDGLKVIEAWGFKYLTVAFVWVKINPGSTRKLKLGLGYYTRPNAEVCLLAKKRTVRPINRSINQVHHSRVGKHSEKPGLFRDQIVKLLGDKPRIELFARHKINGWDQWGNQVPLYNIMDFC
jgi:N6-adenosine-specific RNA methylase IME4